MMPLSRGMSLNKSIKNNTLVFWKTCLLCCLISIFILYVPVAGANPHPADSQSKYAKLIDWSQVATRDTLNEKYEYLANEYQKIFEHLRNELQQAGGTNPSGSDEPFNNLDIIDSRCTPLDYQKWLVLKHIPELDEILDEDVTKSL